VTDAAIVVRVFGTTFAFSARFTRTT